MRTIKLLLSITAILLIIVSCSKNEDEPIARVSSVELDNLSLNLFVGESKTLIATVLPENAANKNVKWKSSKPDVATVDDKGKVTAVESGDATITVTTEDGGKIAVSAVSVTEESVPVQIPDAIFRTYILENFDVNKDGEISSEEADAIIKIECYTRGISSLEGIEFFPNLEELHCSNNKLTKLDISNNTKLKILRPFRNNISSLDLSKALDLIHLECFELPLEVLDLSKNTELEFLDCFRCGLTKLDLSNNTKLAKLFTGGNPLGSLDISNNPELTYLSCYSNLLTELDVSKNPKLHKLNCSINSDLALLNLNNNPLLEVLDCSDSGVKEIDLSSNLKLREFDCSQQLVDGLLKSLDISNNQELTSFNSKRNPNLKMIQVWEGFDTSNPLASIKNCIYDPECSFVVKTKNILDKITDPYFKDYCKAFDTNADGVLTQLEAESVLEVNCSNKQIKSVDGLEYFVNITKLDVSKNELKELFLGNNKLLTELRCNNNQLTKLEIMNNSMLEKIYCGDNTLTNGVNLSKCPVLKSFDCYNAGVLNLDLSLNTELDFLYVAKNKLSELNLANNTKLTDLTCHTNALKSLTLTTNVKLKRILCYSNQLEGTLDLSNNPELTLLQCFNNKLEGLEISNSKELQTLACAINNLSVLDISNNKSLTSLACKSNPSLSTIYVWEGFNTTTPKESIKTCTYDSHTSFEVKK